jgi:polysaccharide biosynthesis/export protein
MLRDDHGDGPGRSACATGLSAPMRSKMPGRGRAVIFYGILHSGRRAAVLPTLAQAALWAAFWAVLWTLLWTGAATAQTNPFAPPDDWRSLRQPFGTGVPPAAAQTPAQGTASSGSLDTRAQPLDRAAVAGEPAVAGVLPTASRTFDRTAVDPDFRLGPGDVLLVNVLEDPTLDTEVLVRPDGLITVPLAGTVMAAGRTPEEVAAAIRQELASNFVEPPTVSVVLRALAPTREEEQLLTIYVIGQVARPGQILIEQPIGFLQALALAGGVGIFGKADEIQVRKVDEAGVERVLVLDYEAIEEGGVVPKVILDDGDTILVPERGLFD